MITWTTPTLMITIKGVQLENVEFAVTITQGDTTYTLENPTVQLVGCNTVLTVGMTQQETAQFMPGTAKLQVNWTDGYGHRNATKKKAIAFGDNLLKEVM